MWIYLFVVTLVKYDKKKTPVIIGCQDLVYKTNGFRHSIKSNHRYGHPISPEMNVDIRLIMLNKYRYSTSGNKKKLLKHWISRSNI